MGNRIKAISPENETFKYKYDNLYRLIELESGKASEKIVYSYDALGRNIEEKRVESTTANTFDAAGQLLEMKHYKLVVDHEAHGCGKWKNKKKEPTYKEEILALRQYSYDLAGNRISMTDENGKVTAYSYDNSNWLTQVVYPNNDVVTYAYNDAGDRISEKLNDEPVVDYFYDSAGRMLSKGDESFSYDADGNMLTDALATYTWNSDNRLVKVEKNINGCKHGKDRKGYGFGHLKHVKEAVVYEEYAYLPMDWRRVIRKVGKYSFKTDRKGNAKKDDESEQTFVSIYDGEDESHEYLLTQAKFKLHGKCKQKESLKLFREFVGGPAADDIEHTRYNRLSLAMLKDGLGSTIALTGRNGKTIARIGYDAWGEFRWVGKDNHAPCKEDDFDGYLDRLENTRGFGRGEHNGWAFGRHFGSKLTPYLYTGRRFSSITSQYFNRHRYYSPALGRFTQKDPIGFNGGYNLYRYADNNPMRWVDPWGLFLLPVVTDDISCPRSRNYYLTMPHQPISEVTWGTIDFVWHYYTGGGAGVNLADIGLLEAFKSSESVLQSIRTLKLMIDNAAFSKARELCNPCEKGQKDGSFDVEYTPTSSVIFDPGLFSVGKSSFFQKAKCRASVNCDDKTFSFSCSTDFRISDKFIDPLELGFEPGGTPYDINAAWSGTYSGNDNF